MPPERPNRPRTGSRPDPRAERDTGEGLERDTVNRAIDEREILSTIRISQQLLSSRLDSLEDWREELREGDLEAARRGLVDMRAKEAKRLEDEASAARAIVTAARAAAEAERAESKRRRYEWWRLVIASVLSFILAAILAYAQAALRK